MDWTRIIGESVEYIESHILDEITVEEIAKNVGLSPFFFQKGFAMFSGYNLGEYIRNRRLSLAGNELLNSDCKVIDVALKYGYDSPDSFTKAFARFHGVNPTAVRKEGTELKLFGPLKINFSLNGGFGENYKSEDKEYKIVKKPAFTVVASLNKFDINDLNENSSLIPSFWANYYGSDLKNKIFGMFGIMIETGNKVEYLIADIYNPKNEIPEGMVTRVIPESEWVVFPFTGAFTGGISEDGVDGINEIIYKGLAELTDYELNGEICIENYDNVDKYLGGVNNEKYFFEVWIPVKKK